MDKILEYLISRLILDSPLTIEEIVIDYLDNHYNYASESPDYFSRLDSVKRQLLTQIDTLNSQLYQEGFDEYAINYLSKDKYVVSRGKYFSVVQYNQNIAYEDANLFSDRIGYRILKMMGCEKSNIHITKNTRDGGIDYWGKYYIKIKGLEISSEIIIVGQVKTTKNKVSVKELREFIGSIEIAKIKNEFNCEKKANISIVAQFIILGEVSRVFLEEAKLYNVHVITSRGLNFLEIL